MKLNRNIKLFINYFLGPLLFIWLSWSIYHQVKGQPNLETAWAGIKDSFNSVLLWNLLLIVVLMVVNWSIEAIKGRISVHTVQPVSFWRSFRAVLSGVSFSVSTPNRIGEYFGRVLYMDEGNRLKTISVTIVGSMSQLIVTIAMGALGVIMMRDALQQNQLVSPLWMKAVIGGILAILVGLLIFYFRLPWLIRLVEKIQAMKKFVYLVSALDQLPASLLAKLLLLSFLRFNVFIAQYYLAFPLFDVDLGFLQTYWGVSVSFLVMAAIPTIAIIELPLRGKTMTMLLGLYTVNHLGLGFSTATIWLINLVIPAIAGSLLILGLRKLLRNGKAERIDPSLKD